VVSAIRVGVQTLEGRLDLSFDVSSVNVQESFEGVTGSFVLPVYRSTTTNRKRWTDIISRGDQVTIHMLNWTDNGTEEWECVLDGIIGKPRETTAVRDDSFQNVAVFPCADFASFLRKDTVAWWLFAAKLEGYQPVLSKLTPDELNDAPHRVAFNYLSKVGLYYANYEQYNVQLSDRIALRMDGLKASAPLQFNMQTAEGPHLGIVQANCVDDPLQELLVYTERPSRLPKAEKVQNALKPVGAGNASTVIQMRAAPYPYLDANGKGVLREWQALPLHELEDDIVDEGETDIGHDAVKNYFMCSPNWGALTDQHLLALGAAVENANSIKRHGHDPLKIATRLIVNKGVKQQTLEEFILALTWRLAGQWNHMQLWKAGSIATILHP
jgi:hypothetical protein